MNKQYLLLLLVVLNPVLSGLTHEILVFKIIDLHSRSKRLTKKILLLLYIYTVSSTIVPDSHLPLIDKNNIICSTKTFSFNKSTHYLILFIKILINIWNPLRNYKICVLKATSKMLDWFCNKNNFKSSMYLKITFWDIQILVFIKFRQKKCYSLNFFFTFAL